jgi:hypothetical protein
VRTLTIVLLWLSCQIAHVHGQGFVLLDSPHDDFKARLDIEKAHEKDLAAPAKTYEELITRLQNYQASDIKRIFRSETQQPDAAVRPIFGGRWSGLPGIIIDFHRGWYAMGDVAFVEYCFDGDAVLSAVLYFRSDDSFVPLRGEADFKKRFQWDLDRLHQVQRWIEEHPRLDSTGT